MSPSTPTRQAERNEAERSEVEAPAKPILINEKTYKTLRGDDRDDYIRAVKNYNKTGDKIYRTAALYFENGKQNPNGINIPLLKKVQRIYYQIDKDMYQKEMARRAGVSLTHLQHIISGSHTGLNDNILHQTHKKLKKTAISYQPSGISLQRPARVPTTVGSWQSHANQNSLTMSNMKIIESTTRTIRIEGAKSLDPITVMIDEKELGKGKINIECYGQSWSAWWGAMGNRDLISFFLKCNTHYIIGKLAPQMSSEIIDPDWVYDGSELADDYDPPTIPNPQYAYLERIVNAVQEAFTEIANSNPQSSPRPLRLRGEHSQLKTPNS